MPEKPRIGYIWGTPLKAGERHIRRQVLGSRRFDPVVLTRRHIAASSFPAPTHRLTEHRKQWIKFYRKYVLRTHPCVYDQIPEALDVLVRDLRIELIHVFFGSKAVRYLPALARLQLPVSVSFHGVDVGECAERPDLAPDLPWLFRTVDCVMVRSGHMAGELIRLGCAEAKIWINRAGVPLEEFPLLERSRAADHPPTFVQVCRLIPKKGLKDTIAAFDRVRAELPDAQLWIVGEGELRAALVSEIERRGLADAVRVTGFVDPDELRRLLGRADVFVHPSVTTPSGDHEGIPNSLLEAMATGLPPIATRHAGIPEAVADGEHGWLVDEHSPDQLAARMLWCARNPEARRAAGIEAHRFVEREHSLDERMRLLDEKFNELIERRVPRERSAPAEPASSTG
jgi:glycosyltransferase involved in cell wall biosynthesis